MTAHPFWLAMLMSVSTFKTAVILYIYIFILFFILTGRTICMDLPMSQMVRENFISLMVDCDHRQNLLQDLILTNNQLK